MKITTSIALCALAVSAPACKKKAAEPTASADPKTTEQATATPAPLPPVGTALPNNPDKHACADWAGAANGDDCKMKGPAPFVVKYAGTYKKDAFGGESPVWNVTNNFDHEVAWGEFSIWYYDAAGKVLELDGPNGKFTRFRDTGTGRLEVNNAAFKPGETRQFVTGVPKNKVPPTVASFEAEITGWGWDKYGALKDTQPAISFRPYADRTETLDVRPQGGWK